MIACLDPGHGGRDPGNTKAGNEKDVVLGIALQTRAALQRCGVTVIMTRGGDHLPAGNSATIENDLLYRAQIANNADADLFVSFHTDSAENPAAVGIGAFVQLGQAKTATGTYAGHIVGGIAAATGQHNRGVKEQDLSVCRNTKMPAVLIEYGFASHPVEGQRLATDAYQTLAAEATAAGICAVLGVAYRGPLTKTDKYGVYQHDKLLGEYDTYQEAQHEALKWDYVTIRTAGGHWSTPKVTLTVKDDKGAVAGTLTGDYFSLKAIEDTLRAQGYEYTRTASWN